jgi:SAM-dependent methyltransferase
MIPTAAEFLTQASKGQIVADIGCYGWRLADICARCGHTLIGIDQTEPSNRPTVSRFAVAKDGRFDLPDDTATITVASHVLEHVIDAVGFFREMMRITKPGGTLWIEAPSELSAASVGSDDPTDHRFLSFWDDPTHIRPWTPGALYRLALSCYCYPKQIERVTVGDISVVRMLGVKPADCQGSPPTAYVSLLNVMPGLQNAWRHVWGKNMADQV